MASSDGDSSPRRRGKRPDSGTDEAVVEAAAESFRKFQEGMLKGCPMGGVRRPWMNYGAALQSRNLVEDVGVILWEGGAKSTVDLKREIMELLDQTDSLVVLVDLKRAEHPEDPNWWPSLRMILAWVDEDPFFAKAIDQWRHARQEVMLERTIHDLFTDVPLEKGQLAVLKERVKFAAGVLPRTVNKGMRDKVDVETTQNHLHLHASLSDEALEDRLAQMSRDPQVRALVAKTGIGTLGHALIEGEVVMPPGPRRDDPLPFRDAEEIQQELGGGGAS